MGLWVKMKLQMIAMQKLLISQSMLTSFDDVTKCDIIFEQEYIKGKRLREPSDAMLHGLFFEERLIGGTRDGEHIELPKLKSGKPSKVETDLLSLVEKSSEVMKRLKIEIIESQPEWVHNDLIAHPDLLAEMDGQLCIVDIKLTGSKETENCRWNPFAWGENLEHKDYTQAVHYVYMYHLITGDYLPFYYLVFGKSGWVKLIQVAIKGSTLIEHESRLNTLRTNLSNFKPQPIKSYTICSKCPLSGTCASESSVPNLQTIVV